VCIDGHCEHRDREIVWDEALELVDTTRRDHITESQTSAHLEACVVVISLLQSSDRSGQEKWSG